MRSNESKGFALCLTAGDQKCLLPKSGLTSQHWPLSIEWGQRMLILISKTSGATNVVPSSTVLPCQWPTFLPTWLCRVPFLNAPSTTDAHTKIHTTWEDTNEANWFSPWRLENYVNTWLSPFPSLCLKSFTPPAFFPCFCLIDLFNSVVLNGGDVLGLCSCPDVAGVGGGHREHCLAPCRAQAGPPPRATCLQRSAGPWLRNPGLNQESQTSMLQITRWIT